MAHQWQDFIGKKIANQVLHRINECTYPLEEEHMQQFYKVSTGVNKILILNKEIRPGRV